MESNPKKCDFMIVGSVCSGIGAPETAWHPLGWQSAFMSEIAPQACAVLRHHNPGVPRHGDFTTIQAGAYADINVLVGGTPCQSFSVAGLRGGMADGRGNLALEYLRLADRLRPRWLVWENVPGVLSSNAGRDFGAFLGGVAELGYGFAYRVLDAQYFGVPQRRQRVFVVGYFGDWRRAAAVLFEPQSMRGDNPPRRATGEGVAGTLEASLGRRCGQPNDHDPAGGLIANPLGAKKDGGWRGDLDNDTFVPTVSLCLNAHPNRIDGESETFIAHTLRGEGFDASEDGTGRGTPLVPVATAFIQNQRDEVRLSDVAGALQSQPGMKQQSYVHQQAAVRRLTPTECLRLQGFPDDHLDVLWKGKPLADGPRYRMIGNSMAVPVMRWIGERIDRAIKK